MTAIVRITLCALANCNHTRLLELGREFNSFPNSMGTTQWLRGKVDFRENTTMYTEILRVKVVPIAMQVVKLTK